MQKFLFTILFTILTVSSYSQTDSMITFKSESAVAGQSAWKSFWKLTGPEKTWVITHPFIAGKARRISNEARAEAASVKRDTILDGDDTGGRVDAFRHVYWMARLSQEFCWKKAIRLGKAHEKGNYRQFKKGQKDEELVLPDSISSVMDLFNNNIGVSIGCLNPDFSREKLKTEVIKTILVGKAKIILKNTDGLPLDCSGNILDISKYNSTWSIPKCLINSGF